ncbi:hypothetical protein IAR55_000323 [Kwoniella newhampshirensis]|uniref:DNA binding protein Ncp1 n=1 Tax=Kwoniella newhampshirensis TaxID=1651941 RepID=A0AAW0Z6E1_9TREE
MHVPHSEISTAFDPIRSPDVPFSPFVERRRVGGLSESSSFGLTSSPLTVSELASSHSWYSHFANTSSPTLAPKSPITASEAIQLGLVGLLSRPVINAVFPSERSVQTTVVDNRQPEPQQQELQQQQQQQQQQETTSSGESRSSTDLLSQVSTTQSSPTTPGRPVFLPITTVPALGGAYKRSEPASAPEPAAAAVPQPEPVPTSSSVPVQETVKTIEETPATTPAPAQELTVEPAYLPALYTANGTHPINMTTATAPSIVEDHDQTLSRKAESALDLNKDEQEYERQPSRPVSRATQRTSHTHHTTLTNGNGHLPNGRPQVVPGEVVDDDEDGVAGTDANNMALGSALDTDPSNMKREAEYEGEEETAQRPSMSNRASRSYVKPIPIVTTYERELPDTASVNKRKSIAGSTKAPSVKPPTVKRAASKAASVRSAKPATINTFGANGDSQEHFDHHDQPEERYVRPPSRQEERYARPASRQEEQYARPASRTGSRAGSVHRLPQFSEGAGGIGIGQVATHEHQHQLQQGRDTGSRRGSRTSLHDQGPISRDRSTTFEEPQHDHSQLNRSMSPNRPRSAFGHRPLPLMAIEEGDRPESRYDGRDSRAGVLGRSGTVMSRANTLGRNGTLSRGANGGTIGSRKGAFGRGAGASIGTQPEEVLGRDDIHARAELSERILDDVTLRKLSTMEKKDARRLTKVIKAEAKSESKAVAGSIKELERLVRLQRDAANAERKSQLRLAKFTKNEHKARLRFLKEKERYERVEGELRNAENDYEERRDHAAGLTAQVAERTYELDDLRAQKAADDRERAVKILALKNPAHS